MRAFLGMEVERVAARFRLDSAAWFRATEKIVNLAGNAQAVWDERVLLMRYWRKEEAQLCEVKPLGLLVTSGAWYMRLSRGPQVASLIYIGDYMIPPPERKQPTYICSSVPLAAKVIIPSTRMAQLHSERGVQSDTLLRFHGGAVSRVNCNRGSMFRAWRSAC